MLERAGRYTLAMLNEGLVLVVDRIKHMDDPPTPIENHQFVKPIQDIPIRWSTRLRRSIISDDFYFYLGEFDFNIGHVINQDNFHSAINYTQSDMWISVMKEEI